MIQQRTYNALLNSGAQTILDTSGNGIAVCGPTGAGATWTPVQIGVNTTTNVSTPIATLYIGAFMPVYALNIMISTAQISQIAATSAGNGDSIGLVGVIIPPGQALIVQWVGGDFGAQATMTVTGMQTATYWR